MGENIVTHIEIDRPRIEDIGLINEFFRIVLCDTFERNNLLDLVETYNEEIEDKRQCLNQDFQSGGKDRYFLIAKEKGLIVGSIEYGLSNDLINSCTNGKLKECLEIGTAFVHPKYQKKVLEAECLTLFLKRWRKKE